MTSTPQYEQNDDDNCGDYHWHCNKVMSNINNESFRQNIALDVLTPQQHKFEQHEHTQNDSNPLSITEFEQLLMRETRFVLQKLLNAMGSREKKEVSISKIQELLELGKDHKILRPEICDRILSNVVNKIPWNGHGLTPGYCGISNKISRFAPLVSLAIEYGGNPGAIINNERNNILQAMLTNVAAIDKIIDTQRRHKQLSRTQKIKRYLAYPRHKPTESSYEAFYPCHHSIAPLIEALCNTDFPIDHTNQEGLNTEELIRQNTANKSRMYLSHTIGQLMGPIMAQRRSYLEGLGVLLEPRVGQTLLFIICQYLNVMENNHKPTRTAVTSALVK